jgi:hypothetical protein
VEVTDIGRLVDDAHMVEAHAEVRFAVDLAEVLDDLSWLAVKGTPQACQGCLVAADEEAWRPEATVNLVRWVWTWWHQLILAWQNRTDNGTVLPW